MTLSVARNYSTATTISYNGIDYAIFAGGYNGSSNDNTIDVFYFNSSGTFSKLSTSLTLSVARRALTATTISYNGIDYAIFAGGRDSSGLSNVIDIFYFNSSGTFSKLRASLNLSLGRELLVSTTISYNGVDYAVFGGGSNDNYSNTIDVFYFNSSGKFNKLSASLTLSVARMQLTVTTISYNGIDYAVFGGGNTSNG